MSCEPANCRVDETDAPQWQASNLFVHLLDGRWTPALLSQLVDGGCRYQDLHDALNGISYKVLTDTLRRAAKVGGIGLCAARPADHRRRR
jgi:DNA-binding HxlR family transcriptional regulator